MFFLTINSPVTVVYLLVSIIISFVSSQLNSDQLPAVLWSQYSQPWSKLRGILQPPSNWKKDDYSSYSFVSCEPRNEYMIHAIDYNPKTNEVYWSDPSRNMLSRQPWSDAAYWKNDRITRFLKTDGVTINGIAVDWLTGNVYCTDEKNGAIIVANDDSKLYGSNYRVIASGDMERPKAIVVDPVKGLVFWTDIGSSSPSIQSSSTTGENRKTILSTGKKPVGLAIDRDSMTLFWVEEATSTIYSCGYDGSNPKELYTGTGASSNRAIAITETDIFVVVETQLKLLVHSRSTGELQHDLDIDAFPYDVTTLKKLLTTPSHECDNKNCDQLCVNVGNGKGECWCREGCFVGFDGRTCQCEGSPRYVYAVGKSVMMVNATINPFNPQNITLKQGPLTQAVGKSQAVGADYRTRFVHFSDTERGSLSRINDIGGQLRELTVQQPQIYGISVHWVDQSVYWTDYTLQHIMVFKPDGRYHRIVMTNLTQPMGLSLDSKKGLLYWSQGPQQIGIYRSNLDGTGRELFSNTGSAVYQQITVDLYTQRLYWSDPQEKKLAWIHLETKEIQQAYSSNAIGQLYGATVYQDYLTWTEGAKDLQLVRQSNKALVTVNNSPNSTNVQHTESFDVVNYGTYLQPDISTSCRSNGCEQHCHSLKDRAVCACAIGFELDGRSCKSSLTDRDVLFFTDPYHKQIYQINGTSTIVPIEVQGVKLPLMEYPVAFEVDGSSGRIYWIDSFTRQIKYSTVNGKNEKVLLDIPLDSTPKRLALHKSSRWLYYTDFTRGAIYKLNADTGKDHSTMFDRLSQPYTMALDQSNEMIYWSDYSGKTLRTGSTKGQRFNDLGSELGNITCLDLRSDDQILYAGDMAGGRIIQYNVSTREQKILYTSPGQQIYALSSSQHYIYFTAWNYKGIYRIRRDGSSGNIAEAVVTPVFARLTDLKYVEVLVIPVAALPLGAIIGGAIGGLLFLLLLLLLLLALLALLRKRKNPSKAEPSTLPSANDLETGAYPTLSTIAGSASVVDGTLVTPLGVRLPGNPQETIHPNTARRRPPLNDTSSDLGAPSSLFSEGGSGIGLLEGSSGGGLGGPESTAAAAANPLAAAAAAAGASRFEKNPNGGNQPPHKKLPLIPTGFALAKGGKQGTFIQRLANRLRTPLGMNGRGDGGTFDPPDSSPLGPGSSAELESSVNFEQTGQLSSTNRPQIKTANSTGWGFMFPPKTHRQPTGFKPASACVPTAVKSTFGRSQGQKAASELSHTSA